MAWVRIDDQLPSHPKILQAWNASPASIGLWAMGLAWSARTDGEVTADFVHTLLPNRRQRDQATSALVDASLWVPNGRSWQIHDWTDYNPTRAQVEQRRQSDSARKRRGIQ